MPLTKEQIDELLAGETKIKPTKYGTYDPPKYEPPKQTGPVRFLRDGKTQKCTYFTPEAKMTRNEGICCAPAYITVNGKYRCNVHGLVDTNKMLVDLGVTE